jgi:hypothetical protein
VICLVWGDKPTRADIMHVSIETSCLKSRRTEVCEERTGLRRIQLAKKQYVRPAPPELFRPSWLQPREPCEEFQEFMCLVSLRPVRSWWPTIADPSPLFVQFPQVVSPPAVE